MRLLSIVVTIFNTEKQVSAMVMNSQVGLSTRGRRDDSREVAVERGKKKKLQEKDYYLG